MRSILALAGAAVAALLTAGPAAAITVLPPDTGSVTFTAFRSATSGRLDAGCSKTFVGQGGGVGSCSGQVFYQQSDADGFPVTHVTGSATGTGNISGGEHLTATASLNVSGGDEFSGAGRAVVTTEAEYFVNILPLGTMSASGLLIPTQFNTLGSLSGSASTTNSIQGEASTALSRFSGHLIVDSTRASFFDGVSKAMDAGAIFGSYGTRHSVVFDYAGGGDPVARVSLLASCGFGSNIAGAGTGNCSAMADPFAGFDQAAFDATMGANTFILSDFFRIQFSPALETSGAPEPALWVSLIAGFGLIGAAIRRRARLA
jgi:hypothetical protein